jgi:NAD+ diphosphatase
VTIAFISSELDRSAQLRPDAAHIAKLQAAHDARFVWVKGDHVWTQGGQLRLTPARQAIQECEAIFLGVDPAGVPWFAARAPDDAELTSLRELMVTTVVPAAQLSIVAQARSMVSWHESHAFCSKCGHATKMVDAGYRRQCDRCSAAHFPRTDPVVIMAVVEGDAVLLGRQATWPPGMYSALAGFMEPGETIEQAVAREVREEAGVGVGDIRYVASQPWPFPSSLMVGMLARAQSRELTIDHSELEDVRWFGKADAQLMLARKHPQDLFAAHPHAIAHQLIAAALDLI